MEACETKLLAEPLGWETGRWGSLGGCDEDGGGGGGGGSGGLVATASAGLPGGGGF